MDGAAEVTPSNSMLDEKDWLLKLETGALTEDDYESFASAPRSEVRAASALGDDVPMHFCRLMLTFLIDLVVDPLAA
jgi:hypothetical protein